MESDKAIRLQATSLLVIDLSRHLGRLLLMFANTKCPDYDGLTLYYNRAAIF